MQMNPLIAGNWKMHGRRSEVTALLDGILEQAKSIEGVDWLLFPPFVFLEQAQAKLGGSNVQWGAQNICAEEQGAFTGEIAASMVKEFGCAWVVIGHSERRHLFGESEELIARKCLMAMNHGLTPILCVGETAEEHAAGQTETVVARQLQAIKTMVNEKEARFVIAYEPVWAIGTGKTASPEQAQQVHQFIRQKLRDFSPELAENTRILYGGSVKPDNAAELFAMPDINGFLVGGASLNAETFCTIGELCNISS